MSSTKSGVTGKWDEAIADAKKHVQRLQAVIRTLEEKKAEGEPWPVGQSSVSGHRRKVRLQ